MRRLLALLLVPLAAACATTAVRDLDGRPLDPYEHPGVRATVLLFTDTECPIANAYAPEVQRLAAEFGPRGVRFYLVYADPERSPAEVGAHREAFGYTMPALLDPEHELVARTGATTTPEACLLLPSGELAYRGRIDDRYADFGKQRAAPTQRELRDALESVLAGRPPPVARAPVLGCTIPARIR